MMDPMHNPETLGVPASMTLRKKQQWLTSEDKNTMKSEITNLRKETRAVTEKVTSVEKQLTKLREIYGSLLEESTLNDESALKSVIPSPNPQAGGPPLIGCPRLLIQYIRSYPPYLEAVSSIRNLRTCHAVVIGTHNTWNTVNCPKTGLNLTSDTKKAPLMRQLVQEIMGYGGHFLSPSIAYIAD
ncbi:hypothetical protein ANN_24550 [Periplaneta americana]|uniref:Uncharacterized protein n=1 Tax=Periplaneta americana TaxID=6978 RepID=A0ABQ8S3K5_PERAM|nr:hypothetical protein ANN_24550 [Periplaneta americana]